MNNSPIRVVLAKDGLSLRCPGFGRVKIQARAVIDGRTVELRKWKTGRPGRFSAQTPEGEWSLEFRATEGGLDAVLGVRLRARASCVRLEPLVVARLRADHVLAHGRKMGGCRLLDLKKAPPAKYQSHFHFAATRGAVTLLLAHPLRQHDLSSFSIETERNGLRNFSAGTLFECNRKRVLRSAPVSIAASAQGHRLLEDWATAQIAVSEPLPAPRESGWNSWDYYRWTITEEEVMKNAEFIASDPVLAKHVKRIIVDDGWQYCYGEWEANSLFPSGTKKLARDLARMGFEPGLWFAPTIAEPHSRWAQLEPGTLACGVSGYPCLGFSCMERKGFILDPTHPRVRAWWKEVFGRYAREGYRYFKLDFLAWTVPARRFWDAACQPGDLMRRIIEPIRQAVGPAGRILGCNLNFEDVRGLVNDARISSDIHARWRSVKENVAPIAARFWAHRRFWINDPDFTLCRGEETANDPDLHRLKALLPFVRPDDPNVAGVDYLDSLVDLSRREAEVLVSLVIISGGAMNLSDNLPRLNEAGLRLLRRAVQAEKGHAGLAVDLFRSQHPAAWVQKLDSGTHRVLLINWEEEPREIGLDLAVWNVPRREARNFWTGQPVSIRGGRLEKVLPPHACLLVETQS